MTITANGSLFYGGMQNINEEHSTDPAYDFTISLYQRWFARAGSDFAVFGNQHQFESDGTLRHF